MTTTLDRPQIRPLSLTNAEIAVAAGIEYSKLEAGALPVTKGGTGTVTALTPGSVVFAGASGVYSQDNANLFWDDAADCLGIGTLAPTVYARATINTSPYDIGLRIRSASAPRYRNDWAVAASGVVTSGYDDTGAVFLPFTVQGSQVVVALTNGAGSFEHAFGKGGTRYAVLDGLRIAGGDTGYTIYQPSGAMGIHTESGALTLGANGSALVLQPTGGPVGIGITGPTAALHLKAGTAAANTAPLKFTAGVLLTTPALGAVEFVDDGTTGHLYVTQNVAGVLTRVQLV